jgi:hypothetical protein
MRGVGERYILKEVGRGLVDGMGKDLQEGVWGKGPARGGNL